MSRRTVTTKGAAKAAPAPLGLYRVTFEDVTTWEAFIKAPDAGVAMKIAAARWNEAGMIGFDAEHQLDLVREGCMTRAYHAEDVPL